MTRTTALGFAALMLLAWSCETATAAGGARTARTYYGSSAGLIAADHAAMVPWHGYYYKPEWGMPLALVVPPTAEAQTHWGWGVGNTRVTPIRHQYGRNWPGPAVYYGQAYLPMPPWPSDTDQMGVYYIRGPW